MKKLIYSVVLALLAIQTSLAGWNGIVASDNPASYGSVTKVEAILVVPALSPSSAHNSYIDYWIGLDGIPLDGKTSRTVEQIGVDSKWYAGAQYNWLWVECYPKKVAYLDRIQWPISAGDYIGMSVEHIGGGRFRFSAENFTAGWFYSTTLQSKQARLLSAEWIVEAITYPTAIFNPAGFLDCYRTVNGQRALFSAGKFITVSQDGYLTTHTADTITITQ